MDVVVFGNRNFASLAWHALSFDSPHDVVCFTVDSEYIVEREKHGLPVVAFDNVEVQYLPSSTLLIVPMTGADANHARTQKFLSGRKKGYHFVSWIASTAAVANDLRPADNCMIFDGTSIQPFCRIGSNVIIRNGCHISHHVVIGDNCFLAPGVVVCGGTSIGDDCMLGANCTIRDNVSIAPGSIIGAGAVVTRTISEAGTYVGVPAKRIK